MKAKIQWGLTPLKEEKHIPVKIFGEATININHPSGIKRKAKRLANSCHKLRDTVSSNINRSWIYWQNWKDNEVLSSDTLTIKHNAHEYKYKAFIKFEVTEKAPPEPTQGTLF